MFSERDPGLPLEVDHVFEGQQCFYNWCQDLAHALESLVMEDASWCSRAVDYAQEFRALLQDSEHHLLVNMGLTEAEALESLGRHGQVERLFESLLW